MQVVGLKPRGRSQMRNFMNTRAGLYTAYSASVLAVALLGWIVLSATGSSAAQRSADRVFIDARTGGQFGYTLSKGETVPVPSPFSNGERVGYEAEPCYWKADGSYKSAPTWVLPRVKVDLSAGATFCDECDRLVVPRNPEPMPGAKPPPTRAEYKPPSRRALQEAGEYPEPDRLK